MLNLKTFAFLKNIKRYKGSNISLFALFKCKKIMNESGFLFSYIFVFYILRLQSFLIIYVHEIVESIPPIPFKKYHYLVLA